MYHRVSSRPITGRVRMFVRILPVRKLPNTVNELVMIRFSLSIRELRFYHTASRVFPLRRASRVHSIVHDV